MSVMTSSQYSAFGDKVGSWGAKNYEGVDFVRKAFEAFDVDKSGFIARCERKQATKQRGMRQCSSDACCVGFAGSYTACVPNSVMREVNVTYDRTCVTCERGCGE